MPQYDLRNQRKKLFFHIYASFLDSKIEASDHVVMHYKGATNSYTVEISETTFHYTVTQVDATNVKTVLSDDKVDLQDVIEQIADVEQATPSPV